MDRSFVGLIQHDQTVVGQIGVDQALAQQHAVRHVLDDSVLAEISKLHTASSFLTVDESFLSPFNSNYFKLRWQIRWLSSKREVLSVFPRDESFICTLRVWLASTTHRGEGEQIAKTHRHIAKTCGYSLPSFFAMVHYSVMTMKSSECEMGIYG